jgi:hypothetical protein
MAYRRQGAPIFAAQVDIVGNPIGSANVPTPSKDNPLLQKYLNELIVLLGAIIKGETYTEVQEALARFRKLDPQGKLDSTTQSAIEAYVANKTVVLIAEDLQHQITEIKERQEYEETAYNANANVEITLTQETTVNMNLLFSLYMSYFGPPEKEDTQDTIGGYRIDHLNLLIEAFESTNDEELLQLAGITRTIVQDGSF